MFNTRIVLRTLPNIYDDVLLQKELKAKSR